MTNAHGSTPLYAPSKTILSNRSFIHHNEKNDREKGSLITIPVKICFLIFLFVGSLITTASSQLATVGGGILTSNRSPQSVFEVHGATPPFVLTRAYVTLSWNDKSIQPTVISAAERNLLQIASASTGLGAGLLWLEANNYKPYPLLVSSTIIPLPVPRTSFVLIGSILPFENFDWSVVFKIGFTLIFVR